LVEVKLIIKGDKGNVTIRGNNFDEVLKEYESNKDKIHNFLGATAEISISTPITKKKKPAFPKTLQGRIALLADERFFDSAKSSGQVRKALREKGHTYSPRAVRVGLLRSVRKRQLRRLTKERKGKTVFVYVIP